MFGARGLHQWRQYKRRCGDGSGGQHSYATQQT
jgi:hypothetical protein